MSERVAVVTGVGPGNGAAFSRKLASEGYRVAMMARGEERLRALEREIPNARGFVADVSDGESVRRAFEAARAALGPIDVLIQNAGSGVFGSFDDVTEAAFEECWRTNALGLFHCAKAVVPEMSERGRGTIVVIGATASLRGGTPFAAFAPAKAAARSLAQSMARLLGPRGIHVAHLVIDGVIDMPRTREFFRDKPDEFFLKPAAIADTVHALIEQDRSAWTFELDVRPFGERW